MDCNPYVGLRPFEEHERDLFFGREAESEILFNQVFSTPLTLVYAPSGVGKSSLLRAGLLPRLRDEAFAPLYVASWERDATAQLTSLIGEAFTSDNGVNWWSDALEAYATKSNRCPVLILDQFEEALREYEDLDRMWDQLALLANRSGAGARVLIGVREDYLAGLDDLLWRVPMLMENGIHLGPMNEEALRRAFHGPLARQETPFRAEGELFDALMRDLREPGPRGRHGQPEPGYFQIVCAHLWEIEQDKADRTLSLATYEDAGGVSGVLDKFVRRKLDDSLPIGQLEVLYAITRYLVAPTGAKIPLSIDDIVGLVRAEDFTPQARAAFQLTPSETERPLADPALYEMAAKVLEMLCGGDVLVLHRVSRGQRQEYELFHDLLGPILLRWRERLRFDSEQELARAAVAVQELHGSFETASIGLDSGNRQDWRELIRRLGDVLLKSSVLKEDRLYEQARRRLWEVRKRDTRLQARLEAARALYQATLFQDPTPVSWPRATFGLLGYLVLSVLSAASLGYGMRAVVQAVADVSVSTHGAAAYTLGGVSLLWALAYFAEGFDANLFSTVRPLLYTFGSPVLPYLRTAGFERLAGWPVNFLISIIPAGVLAPLFGLIGLPVGVLLVVFLLSFTILGLVLYNTAVVLV